MKFKLELEEKLDQAVLTELRSLVRSGHIGGSQVREMSSQHNMDVNKIYDDSRDKEETIELTIDRMLDGWYENTLCCLSQSEAQNKLLEVLRGSHCSDLMVAGIRKLCQAVGGGGGGELADQLGTFRAPPEARSEAGTESGSSQQQPPVLTLSSTGVSAEHHGGILGVFEYVQEYNSSPAYRQKDSLDGTQLWYLHRDGSLVWQEAKMIRVQRWFVAENLGGSVRCLLNKTSCDSVPANNWMHHHRGSWESDPELTVTPSRPSVCGVITISLHGAAAGEHPQTGGEYRATGDWSAGHPVYSNGVTYLSVRQSPPLLLVEVPSCFAVIGWILIIVLLCNSYKPLLETFLAICWFFMA